MTAIAEAEDGRPDAGPGGGGSMVDPAVPVPTAHRAGAAPDAGVGPPAGDGQVPAAAARWLVAAASRAGSSHVRRGLPCDDAHLVYDRPDGLLLVAVADGAGSAAHGGEGARLACERAVEVLDWQVPSESVRAGVSADGWSDRLWRQALRAAVASARGAIARRALDAGYGAGDLGCTLSLVAVSDDMLAAAQVGDGLVVGRAAHGSLVAPLPPTRGEYANETALLTGSSEPGLAVLRARFDAVAATTDGLLRLAADVRTGAPHAPFFDPLLSWLSRAAASPAAEVESAIAGFLGSERVAARTDDDLTLVLAVRTPPS